MLRGLLFANSASIYILLKKGYKKFKDFIIDIKKIYQLIEMEDNKIKMIQVNELILDEANANYYLPLIYYTPGSTPWYDLLILAILVKKYNPKVIFEIGTFEGLGSLVMCNNSTAEILYTLDLPLENKNIVNISKFGIKNHSIGVKSYESGKLLNKIRPGVIIKKLYGDSWNFDFSPYYNLIDFFFIDGAHTLPYVIKDTLNAIRCVRNNGVIVWHDVKNYQVLKPILKIAHLLEIYHVVHSNICFTTIKEITKDAVSKILISYLERFER
jgi:predicted O-methyltransferase YrrM